MGASLDKTTYIVAVKTGGKAGGGTDNNVYMMLMDKDGRESEPIELDNFFHNDFEKNQLDTFKVTKGGHLGDIVSIKLWRDGFIDDAWFVSYVTVTQMATNRTTVFPVHRWIPQHFPISMRAYDSILPQFGEDKDQREKELEHKKILYATFYAPPIPFVMARNLADDEQFGTEYLKEYLASRRSLIVGGLFKSVTSGPIKSMKCIMNLYGGTFPVPKVVTNWKEDKAFAEQKLSGVNPLLIELCTNIPDNFAVSSELVEPFLEEKTLKESLGGNRIFIIDLRILDGLLTGEKEDYLCAPMCLFYLDNNNVLLPVAIQLAQEPGEDNPIFLPSDPPNTWLLAKMWFNYADASYHQSISHLGFTHLVMESICVSAHRQMSPSHPMMRLLAPHLMHLIAINHRGLNLLVGPGEWADQTMTLQTVGLAKLMARKKETWRLDVDGIPPKQIQQRGVDDPQILPHYPYRDDATLLYEAIHKYTNTIVEGVYDTPDKLHGDYELQAWIKELSLPFPQGVDVPGATVGDQLDTVEDVVTMLSAIIYQCSVGHASVNYLQYDYYGFPPAYMAYVSTKRPTSKAVVSEEAILATLPGKSIIIKTMIVTKMLSFRATRPLGDFEVVYGYDDLSIRALTQLKRDLQEIEATIQERNKTRPVVYDVLLPSLVPNSITI